MGRLSLGHVIMLIAGLLAVLVNFTLLRSRDQSFQVAIAAADLRAGTALEAGDLATVSVQVDGTLLESLIRQDQIDGVMGSIVSRPIPAGHLVTMLDLRDPSAPDALRAMSIPIDREHAVGGNLTAGDRIDIVHVGDGRAEYIASSVQVLETASTSSSGLAATGRYSITVAVDARTALRISLAIDAGSMEVIRSTGAGAPEIALYPDIVEETADATPGGDGG